MSATLRDLPKETRFSAWLAVGFVIFICYDQLYYWQNKEDYSFGFLVPMFVAYVIYDRWPKIKAFLLGESEETKAHQPGALDKSLNGLVYLGMFVGMLFFALGGIIRVQGPSNLASLLIACGAASYFLGAAWMASDLDASGRNPSLFNRFKFTFLFLFPALAWLVSAPLVMFMDSTVKIMLLDKVTIIVYHAFDFLGFSITREGNTFILPEGRVGVADACSGVRSLTACIFAGTFLSAVFLDRFWKKFLMVGTAMILAFVTNIFRSLFLTGWAYAYGADSIDGLVHDVAGYAVLIITCILLIALLPIFNFKIAPPDDDDDGDSDHLNLSETQHQS